VPRSVVEDAFARLEADLPGLSSVPFAKAASVDDVPGVVADEHVTAEIDGVAYAAAKAAAMRAHATQLEVAEPYFSLSNKLGQPLFTAEYYELVRGDSGESGVVRESDLFAGIGEAS